MSRSSDGTLLLHTLRLKGFADTDVIAERVGVDQEWVRCGLEQAAEEKLLVRREGRRTGWSLTPLGREKAQFMLSEELESAGMRLPIERLYRCFRQLNPIFLQLCTDWQVIDIDRGLLNSHDDPAYDAAIRQRLGQLDDQIQEVCAGLALALPRFSGYGSRFAYARGQVEVGGHEWFTAATIDSYHTVWFELHEDLLATLGLSRSDERERHPQTDAEANAEAGVSAEAPRQTLTSSISDGNPARGRNGST